MKHPADDIGKYIRKISIKKPEVLIFEQIVDLIYMGKMKVGDQLPPVDAMRERFNVSEAHISKAVGKLVSLGLVTKIPNGELIVSNDTKKARSQLPDKTNLTWVDFDRSRIAPKKYKIGFSQTTIDHPAREFMNRKYMELGKSLGVTTLTTDAHWSLEAEIANIVGMARKGMDGIVVSTHAGNRIKPAVVEVKRARIPTLIFSSGQPIGDWPFDIWASSNDWQQGRIAGYKAALELSGKGRVIEVQGTLGSSISESRTNGILSAFEDFPRIEIVDTCTTNWDRKGTYELVRGMMTRGVKADLVIAHCDEQAIGALRAIKELGRTDGGKLPLKVVSVADAQAETFDYIRSGDILSTMHYEQNGAIALNLILQKLEQLMPPKLVNLGTYLVDGCNVGDHAPDY
jgi:ABC-type sugar transport system substrate-binding protein